MQLDRPIDPVIGPYEVYMDGWFNAKAAFERQKSLQQRGFAAQQAVDAAQAAGAGGRYPNEECGRTVL